MRSHDNHKHSLFMLVGGNGLAVNRLNHALARNSALYLRTKPAICARRTPTRHLPRSAHGVAT
eukprot:1377105-Pleurochrysis_carterae.AAC.1